MKPYTWSPDHTVEETKDGAYWERNMLALLLATIMQNRLMPGTHEWSGGWYPHEGEGFDGWSRVISLYGGGVTFHVPDDFDLGTLRKLDAPNWDGHTTEEKWNNVMFMTGVKPCE